jgi:6-phosphofructokinase 1
MYKSQLRNFVSGLLRPSSVSSTPEQPENLEDNEFLSLVDEEKPCLGVLTSGGDAPGMNACVRAVTRMGISKGMRVFAIHEGYQGMVEGGNFIRELLWTNVTDTIHRGGTIIGTARCKAFRERSGRLQAAQNLVTRGIHNLVVIGGDGSLTGANLFKQEWSGLLQELVSTNRIAASLAEKYRYLNIVGIVGSIDNDMCGTDMTIGVDTALHRIISAIDCVCSTADSHQRSFVIEVMGRHCGYLALMSSIAGQADWVILPENPMEPGWEDTMCKTIKQARDNGRRMSLVVIAEGAVDVEHQPISSAHVKKVLEEKLHHDTRITVLGHIQRGGSPSFYDRLIGCRLGAAAVLHLANAEGEVEPVIAGMQGNQVTYKPMMESVKMTQDVNSALRCKDFETAKCLRGPSFQRNLAMALTLNNLVEAKKQPYPYRFAVTQVGAPACGVNSCISAFVRMMLQEGHEVVGIYEGFEGLLSGDPNNLVHFKWIDVDGLVRDGGCMLGTNRTLPTEANIDAIARQLERLQIHGLFVIGGFEAYQSITALYNARSTHPAFRIPMISTPATISNNVPGTDVSIGSDTALNIIVDSCDKLRQSALASRKRVFVVETHGGYCGYLASMGALAGAADNAYIFEEPFGLKELNEDLFQLKRKFEHGLKKGIVLNNEKAHPDYSTEFIAHFFNGEGKGMFVSRSSILGHLQQGGAPSPYDRILGAKMGSKAVPFLLEQVKKNTVDRNLQANTCESVVILGILGQNYVYTPIELLFKKTDFKYRTLLAEHQWWMPLRVLMRTLARRLKMDFSGETERQISVGEANDPCKTSISFD